MPITASLRPLADDEFDYWKAHHLLNRAGFGGTPGQVQALHGLGLDAAVDYIVDYESVEMPAVTADMFDRNIMRPANDEERMTIRRARQAGDEVALERFRQERQRRQQADRRQMAEVQTWWFKRLIESPRPLEEKMTLFWHGHFAASYRGIEDSYHMFLQNQFFRANATKSFADLVYGIVRDPAMLAYLNNDQNRKERPNENLARELMELFVLGEGNRYGENDIKQGARALTGYTFIDDEFLFRPGWHDEGAKNILGKIGNWDGDDFCGIILSEKVASQFICLKLYRYLVNDAPGTLGPAPQRFVLDLARLMRDEEYSLKPVLKTIFKSKHFYDDENVGSMIKSPVQLVIQAIRSLRTPVRQLRALVSATDMMGQNLFLPPSVKGWDGGQAWINTATMFVRQNLMIYLLTGRRPDRYAWESDGRVFDASHLLEHLRGSAGGLDAREAVEYLLRFNVGPTPHAQRVNTLLAHVEERGNRLDNEVLIEVLLLIAAMPEYQLC